MKQRLLSILAATTLGLGASHASAATVTLSGFTYGWSTIDTVQSTSATNPIAPFSVYAGQYSGTLDGNPFVTFCAELTQELWFGATYTDYSIIDGVDAWGAAKSGQFDRLMSMLIGQNVITNADTSGLAQTAVWETLYESTASNGFASGTFQATSSDPLVGAVSASDWSSLNAMPVSYHVDLLYSPTAQDLLLITAIPVPEPSETALLVAGALGLALVARRRAGPATGRFAIA